MRNIRLTIQYEGTEFAGWQCQKNARAIQEVMQKAIAGITGEKPHLGASGRTDAGVHAVAQVANFKTRSRIPLENLQMALNSRLPKDIVVCDIREAPSKFNAQHDAKSKVYGYMIVNNDFVSPFLRRYAARCFFKLDIGRMRRAARFFVGRHDFRAFQASGSKEKVTVRTVKSVRISRKGDIISIYIEADGFLYNMARSMVGTLVEVGRGKFSAESVKAMLAGKDRRLSGPTAPAKGLCLVMVRY